MIVRSTSGWGRSGSVIGLAVHTANLHLHRPANQQTAGREGTMADTSLWPVALGGLLALGGTVATAVVTVVRDLVQQSREARKRRADKFEELVAAVYEFDHWLTLTRQRELEKKEGIPETVSPKCRLFRRCIFRSSASRFLSWMLFQVDTSPGFTIHKKWVFPTPVSRFHSSRCMRLIRTNAKHCSMPSRRSPMTSFSRALWI
jgi:hypothetical protein